jgi:TRAP-type C4-dicarboxylate transport system permease small subunit
MPQTSGGLPGWLANSYRRRGWIYVGGLVLWLLAAGYKGLPLWLDACMVTFSFLLIWGSFSRSKRLKKMSAKNEQE